MALLVRWLAVTLVGLALATAPTARADSRDIHFITILRNNDGGGKFNGVPNTVLISNAHLACTDLQNGVGFSNVAANLDLSIGGTASFVDTATAEYCPELGGNV